MKRRPPKRYVLLEASGPIGEEEMKGFERSMKQRYGDVKVIPVAGNGRAVIVKTTNSVAATMRAREGGVKAGKESLLTVQTSGSIGKLKRRANEKHGSEVVKVP